LLLIDSTYIYSGGGKVLLKTMINNLNLNKIKFCLLIDKRLYESGFFENINSTFDYIVINKNEFSRFIFYLRNRNLYNTIFCFSSIPPPYFFKNIKVIIYFHNLYLTKSKRINLKKELKKLYLTFFSLNNYKWFVQSKFVKSELLKYNFINKNNIFLRPFFEIQNIEFSNKNNINVIYSYLADNSKHKNHLFLLKSWFLFFENLKEKNIELHLTVEINNNNSELNSIIDDSDLLKKYNIINHSNLSHIDALNLLEQSNFLIFVSEFESFGLPLIEACQFGCKIIAPNKEYVFEVVTPTLTFIPNSINSLLENLLISYSSNDLKDSQITIENQINSILNYMTHV